MHRFALALLAAAACAGQASRSPYMPVGTSVELGLAGYAKVLCSAVFVSSRDPAEAFQNSGFFLMPDDQHDDVKFAVDRDHQLVRVTRGAISRSAKFYGDQGCIIQAQQGDSIHFKPVPVK